MKLFLFGLTVICWVSLLSVCLFVFHQLKMSLIIRGHTPHGKVIYKHPIWHVDLKYRELSCVGKMRQIARKP